MINLEKIRFTFGFILIFACALLFSGCATTTYVGEDYNENNLQTIKTNEDFVFNTYKKSLDNANIKIGISKTPVVEILTLYVQVENLSYETPYTFKVEDLRLFNDGRELQFITANNYLNIYQTQEASSMAAMGSIGASLSNMTGINTNYNEFNQSMIQSAAETTNKNAFSQMETLGNQILKHSVKHSSVISPRRSQYYYFFFEMPQEEKIIVNYKNLTYQFEI